VAPERTTRHSRLSILPLTVHTRLPMISAAPTEPSGTRPRAARAWGAVALGLVAAALWAFLAPEERSLGSGIRMVYLHVSATWAGITFLYGAGILGCLSLLLRSPDGFRGWLRSVWTAGLAAFAAGLLLSLMAAHVSWGGIFWAEPRMRASLGVVAVSLLALAVDTGVRGSRWKGLTWTVAALACFVILRSAGLFIHPDRPIRPTTPWSIRGTFLGMYALFLLTSAALASALPRQS
jgi:hypothetical protein